MVFKDREDAARKLVSKLALYKNHPNAIVLGLPRGGVALAAIIAYELGLPLDIMVCRKLGFPAEPELAIGAIAEDGQQVLNHELIKTLGITAAELREVIAQETKEAERRALTYRGGKSRPNLHNKIVILVDDGVATGATMRAAIAATRVQKAQKVIVVMPVTPQDALDILKKEAHKVITLQTPASFSGISAFYETFKQLTDEEVMSLLAGKI